MNRILKTNSDCSKKQLQIRRFEVTPIKKMMGIFEWVN
jgi:phosphatidylinositol kinase/protein kinase (PI-3  family)